MELPQPHRAETNGVLALVERVSAPRAYCADDEVGFLADADRLRAAEVSPRVGNICGEKESALV